MEESKIGETETERAGRGDDRGRADVLLDDLFRTRFVPMVRMATLMTGSVEEAEEIVMDAFSGLTRLSERLVVLDEPAAYLRTSVVNGVRSRHRRLRAARSTPPPPPGSATDPDVDELWHRLAELTEDQRRCVVLRFYEDLSLEQIASVLGMPIGTVKSHLHRAIAALRNLVIEEAP